MRQDVDAVMTKTEARERGYLPTAEVPALLGVKRDVLQLCQTMRREGLRPIRVGHAYWWSVAAVEAWAAQRRWSRRLSVCCSLDPYRRSSRCLAAEP